MNSLATSPHTRQMSAHLPFSRLQASADDLYPRLFDAILDGESTRPAASPKTVSSRCLASAAPMCAGC